MVEVVAGSDAGRLHVGVADGAHVAVLAQVLGGGHGKRFNLAHGLSSQQEALPTGLQPLPHVEVAVDEQDGRVDPAPLALHGLTQTGTHYKNGHQEFKHARHSTGIVHYVIQQLPGLAPQGVVHEQQVDDHQSQHLHRGHDAAGNDHEHPEVDLEDVAQD